MSKLVPPQGGELKPLLLKGNELKESWEKAQNLEKVTMI